MKKILGALALSLAFFFAPIDGATKEITEHTKYKKTSSAEKRKQRLAEKKAEARRKANKLKAKKVEKEPARVERTRTTRTEKKSIKPSRTAHVQNMSGDKVVNYTNDGRAIYKGPRGGLYYLTDAGNKEYVTNVI
jgi:colicin import membrane protein